MRNVGSVLELVVYTLREGVSRQQFLDTNGAVAEWIARQPGFVSRDCVHDADSARWVDVIWWRSVEQAEAAAAAAMTSESCAPMFALIDMESMLMLHGERALPTKHAAPAPVGA